MSEAVDYFVNETEAAKILGISKVVLRRMRCKSGYTTMPHVPFVRYSPKCIRYSTKELVAWREAFRTSQGAA